MATIALLASTAAVVTSITNNNVSLDVVESIEQMTLPAGEAIPAGSPVRIDVTTGKFVKAAGDTAPHARVYGITVRKVLLGEAVTAIAKGVIGGFDFSSQAYDADIYVADDSSLADAAGTVSKVVGKVIPVFAQTRTGSPLKALRVSL